MKSINDQGGKAPAEYFSGEVNIKKLLNPSDYNTIMVIVSFEAGARTNWHTHSNGQILIVTEGVGYYQEKGKDIQLIQKGDVVEIPVDVEHWHGASKNSALRHIAIVLDSSTDKTEWLDPVTEQEYTSDLI